MIVACFATLTRVVGLVPFYFKTKPSNLRCALRAVTEAHEEEPRKVRLGAIRTMLNAQPKNENVSKVSILAKILKVPQSTLLDIPTIAVDAV